MLMWMLACSGGSLTVDDTAATDTGDPVVSALSGEWDVELSGFVAFNQDWETEPYCSGLGVAAFDDAGAVVEGDGDCVILWGPYTDAMGLWTLSGDETVLELDFAWEAESRSLEVDALTEDSGTWSAMGVYTTSQGAEMDARVDLTLRR